MKIPLTWLKQYIKTDKSPKEIAHTFTMLGLLLDKPIITLPNGEVVFDLEHRMDRSDWLAILGCARDYAAFENIKLNYPQTHTQKGKENGGIDIKVECPDLVNRFNTRVFKNIKVTKSPHWLATALEAYGIPSINNVVDITNYVMVELGQPMHAQDIDKMEKKEILIRRARKGESITTLLGETISLDSDTFVLTQNDKPTVIGGIVGGKTTGVDENTVNIVLDAGNYNQTNVRATSRRLKIQNETVLRYDKFLHPQLTQLAIERATYLLLELCGGDYYENYDYYPTKWAEKEMSLRYSRIQKLGGILPEDAKIKQILTSLEYEVLSQEKHDSDTILKLKVPYFRTDVEVEDDLVADILRINDYSKLPLKPINSAPPKEITPKIYDYENKLKDILVNIGLHEHISDPIGPTNSADTQQVILENALNADKSALRTSIYATLKPVCLNYFKHTIKEVGIFEIGNIYTIQGDKNVYENYTETKLLQIIYTNKELDLIQNTKKVKELFWTLVYELGIKETWIHFIDGKYNIMYQDDIIGEITLDSIWLNVKKLMNIPQKESTRVHTYIHHMHTQDISLVLPLAMHFGEIYKELKTISKDILSVEILEEYIDEGVIGKNKKGILVRVGYTQSDLSVDVKESIVKALKDKFTLEIRG